MTSLRGVGAVSGKRNLFYMRAFYVAYPEIAQTVSAELAAGGGPEKVQIASARSAPAVGGHPYPRPNRRLRQVQVASRLCGRLGSWAVRGRSANDDD
jgi:hypothetical protein